MSLKQEMLGKRKPKTTTLAGLDLRNDGIAFVQVCREENALPKIEVFKFTSCEPAHKIDVLKELSRNYKLKRQLSSCCLEPEDYRLLVTEAPPVPDEELVQALQWDIKELVDIPVDEITLDVFAVPGQEGARRSVNVVAAQKGAVAGKAELFKQAGIHLRILDIEELALRNVAGFAQRNEQGVMLVALQPDYGVIVCVKNDELYFSRRLEGGSSVLNQPDQIENFALEIQRSIDYFDRHFAQVGLSHVVLAPMFPAVDGLQEFLGSNLSLPCNELDLQDAFEWQSAVSSKEMAQCLLALGCALRSEAQPE